MLLYNYSKLWHIEPLDNQIIFVFSIQVLVSEGFPNDTVVVIAGLSNGYSHYVTTFEEYQVI